MLPNFCALGQFPVYTENQLWQQFGAYYEQQKILKIYCKKIFVFYQKKVFGNFSQNELFFENI